MPAVPGSLYGANQQPTCWSKMKTGFTIGFCVGMASGALFGGFSALRYFPFNAKLLRFIFKHLIEIN